MRSKKPHVVDERRVDVDDKETIGLDESSSFSGGSHISSRNFGKNKTSSDDESSPSACDDRRR